MSGWIKWEKSLDSDPRVLRLARRLQNRLGDDAHPCNALVTQRNAPVTLVCGALVRMWSYADTHARDDDVIEVGPDELDEIVGLPGFAENCPAAWLEIIDDEHVKLPHYQEHNGTEAKRRAQTQARVQRHRQKRDQCNGEALQGSNADALPDQDRDQDRDPKEKGGSKTRKNPQPIPEDWQPNETNREWMAKAGLADAEQQQVVDEFIRWARNSGHRKSNWDLAFGRNPAVKSAVGRGRSGGSSGASNAPWQALLTHCRRGHGSAEVAAEDPAMAKAAEWMGGMGKLRRMNETEIERCRGQFQQFYQQAQHERVTA